MKGPASQETERTCERARDICWKRKLGVTQLVEWDAIVHDWLSAALAHTEQNVHKI